METVQHAYSQGGKYARISHFNWTEKDIWQYIKRENIDIVSLYFAAERPCVYRDGNIIMVDDDRMRLHPGEEVMHKKIRFRTWAAILTGGIESDADTLDAIIDETLSAYRQNGRAGLSIERRQYGNAERERGTSNG